MIKKVLICILAVVLSLIFLDPFNSYFSQDDFFHLRQVMDKTLTDIPSIFAPSNELGYAFYRPISREFYNFIMYKIFGLSSLPFHIVNILLILINGFLLYKLVILLMKNTKAALIACILYLFNAIHSVELYYLSSVQTLLATTFTLFALIFFKQYLKYRKKIFNIYSLLFFALALSSHESAIVFVPLVVVFNYLAFQGKLQIFNLWKFAKNQLLILLPFLIIVLFRMIIYLFFTGLPEDDVYKPSINIKNMINILSWYIIWSFNFPEILVDFVGSKFALNPNFLRWYGEYIKITFSLLTLLILILFSLCIKYRKKLFKDSNFLFFIAAYIIAISPFLMFPNHKFVYYLSLPSIFFSAILGAVLACVPYKNIIKKVFLILFISAFIFTSWQTTKLNKMTYWAAKRAEAARFILSDVKRIYPHPNLGSQFYIKNDPEYPFIAKEWGTSSNQAFFILSGSDAFQLLYRDPTIKVYYENVDNLFEVNKSEPLLPYVAKFPY